jgi:hypothetical protein
VQWCHQGVLLLNAALTVRPKQSNSHAGACVCVAGPEPVPRVSWMMAGAWLVVHN